MIFSQIFPTMSATNNPSDWFQIFGADRNIYWKKCRSNKINSKLSPLLPWACYQPGLNLLFFAGGRCSSNICTLVGYGFEKCRKNSFEFIFLELHFKWFGTVFIFSTLHSPQCNPTTGYWFLSSIYSLNKACHLQESSETLFISTSWDRMEWKNTLEHQQSMVWFEKVACLVEITAIPRLTHDLCNITLYFYYDHFFPRLYSHVNQGIAVYANHYCFVSIKKSVLCLRSL